jgi:hypothetical protein
VFSYLEDMKHVKRYENKKKLKKKRKRARPKRGPWVTPSGATNLALLIFWIGKLKRK